jgi:hypothetical protein
MEYRDPIFWKRVAAYIIKLTEGDYEQSQALRAAVLRFNISQTDILENCNLDVDQRES